MPDPEHLEDVGRFARDYLAFVFIACAAWIGLMVLAILSVS